jgi:hypothetical protein
MTISSMLFCLLPPILKSWLRPWLRAERLLKEAVINIQSSKSAEEGTSGENMQIDANSDESMEIDWDRVGENLFSKEGGLTRGVCCQIP